METGSFDTSRFDMNSSGEIAQKFHHFKYNLHVNKKTFRANLQLDWINLYQDNFVSKQPETLTNMT